MPTKLMGPHFEPRATCSLFRLSMKVIFLVAITSARRVGELQALVSKPPYTIFFRDKVFFWPHPKFLSKVVSEFHMNQAIYLLTFFSKPHSSKEEEKLHTLDVTRALAFYLEESRTFRSSSELFVTFSFQAKGHPENLYLDFWLYLFMLPIGRCCTSEESDG